MKQITLLAVIIFSSSYPKAQGLEPVDSVRISFLLKQLKTAKGTKEVDILNDIAWEYSWAGKDKTPMLTYGTQAKKKAEAIRYEKGIGYASLTISWFYNGHNTPATDSFFKKALFIGEKLKDARLLGWCYYKKWDLKKSLSYFRQAKDLEGEKEVVTWLCSQYSTGNDHEANFSYCQRALELSSVKLPKRISHNKWLSGFGIGTMVDMYNYIGDHQTAFVMIKTAEKYLSPRDIFWKYASTYSQMSKYDSSLLYFEKAFAASETKWSIISHVAYANLRSGNYARAIQLFEEATEIFKKSEAAKKGAPWNWRGTIHTRLAQAYDSIGKKKEAIKNYEIALEHSRSMYHKMKVPRKPGDPGYEYEADRKGQLMGVSYDLSKIFQGLRQYDSAFYYLSRYTELKDTVDNKKRIRQINMQLSNLIKAAEDQKRTSQLLLLEKDNFIKAQQLQQQLVLFQKNEIERTLLQKDNEIKDQHLLIANQQLQLKDQGFKEQEFLRKQRESELVLLDKENSLKDQQLKQQTFLRNALLGGLFLLIALAAFIIRYLSLKRKAERLGNEKVKAELEQRSSELEMQALRAQMNPHFIFNCLSSINRFVLKNETEAASDYLTRFSRLIRMVLINSQKTNISLEDELEMLRLYLDMERLRFKHSFDYNIIYSNTVDAGNIFLPPLLLQPFCENAIWHGLMHKDGQGRLDINIRMEKNVLHCTITDNGIGRKKAAELKSKSGEKSKSLGLKITTDRLALLNENQNIQTFYKMHDLEDENGIAEGTRVELQIKYKEEISELVS